MAYTFTKIEKTVATVIISSVLLFISVFILIARNKEWFEAKRHYKSEFTDSSDLREGMEVRFKGFTIGNLTGIRLNEQNTIDVGIVIKKEYETKMRAGSVLKLDSPIGGFGTATIDLKMGMGRGFIRPGEFIHSSDTREGQYLLSQMDLPKNFYMQNLEAILSSVKTVTSDLEKSMRPVGSIMRNLNDTTAGLSQMINSANNKDNSINRFMNDRGTLYTKVDGMLGDFKQMSGNMKKTMVKVDDMISSLRNISRAVEKNPLIGVKKEDYQKREKKK